MFAEIESNRLKDVVVVVLSGEELDVPILEGGQRIEDINVARFKYGLLIFGTKWRHLLEYRHEFWRDQIKWNGNVHLDKRRQHVLGYRGGHHLFKFLLKQFEVADVKSESGRVLVASEFLQKITAFEYGVVQIESINA